jgi:hypothetical protein
MLFHGCLRPQEIETLCGPAAKENLPLGEGVAGFRLGAVPCSIEWAAQPVAYKKTRLLTQLVAVLEYHRYFEIEIGISLI